MSVCLAKGLAYHACLSLSTCCRLVGLLRLNVLISCAIFWPACLDFTVFIFDW
jgi:hypothetical protein